MAKRSSSPKRFLKVMAEGESEVRLMHDTPAFEAGNAAKRPAATPRRGRQGAIKMFQYSLEQSGDVGIVRVKEAKLTYPVLSPFFGAVRRIVEGGARKLVIDLAAVAYMDSVAIGCLIDIHRLLEHRQGAVKFSGLQPRLETMLFMTGVQKVVQVYRDEAEALAAFGGPRKQKGEVLTAVAASGGSGRCSGPGPRMGA
jgi:anti-sigma B factor antagonist